MLPEAFAGDPERLGRFEREARLVASLNHPNIAGIYGIEEDAGRHFLTLEYVEGETLAERITRGPLALDETLDLCRQVAAAVEAAHEGGVVHRDLKPANIKITPAGDVKVLDFGLAKGGSGAASDSSIGLSHSPTMSLAATGAGVILGTAAYMSPEQARGKAVDKRADIWSFGCVLYECLTGRQAFAGETVSDMIARILQGEPDWNALPARTPERIRGLLRRCLEKDARRRLRDIGDARMEIEDVQGVRASSSSIAAAGAAATGSRPGVARRYLEPGAVILMAPTSNGVIYRVPATGGEPQPVTTLDSTRAETAHRFPQFLPDGRHFLFSALPARDGKFEIYVGSLDSPARRLLLSAGTGVTWAPPGHLLYARDGKLIAQGFDAKALELRGDPVSLGDAATGTKGSGGPVASASETGSVAYGTYQPTNQRLAWVDLSGREIASIPVEPGPYSLGSLSPDDRRVALVRTESANLSDLWIADLERGVVTRFTDEPGSFDAVAWSPDGTRIAYLWDDGSPQVLKVKSLAGNTLETFLDSDPLFKGFGRWTPDGRSIIYSRLDPQTQWDLWVLPLDGDRTPHAYLKTRFNEWRAEVSRDGRWISYLSDESGRQEAYVQSFPVPGGKYQVTTGGAWWVGWSPDGRYLGYGPNSDPIHGYEAELQGDSEFPLGPPRVFLTFAKDARRSLVDHAWQRALTLLPVGKDPTPSITVVLNALPGASER